MENINVEIENLLKQKNSEALEPPKPFLGSFEPEIICEVILVLPSLEGCEELKEIQAYWKEEADFYGDRGACVLGAGFEFTYKDKRYFLQSLSRWQGSLSWEHCKDEIQEMLINIGAESITYEWGVMD
ncbi:hypothetical protein KM915_20780 [Cytobacillus oceanisediminis]|uniref:hypothetical protein n=1 Tax=Cytobacillus oceanisediminis TaxID=665099 RepID=UPI001C22AAD6|nr:hypothetical protein [Cytobacillus oceanisediminis]MBU8732486.1 hypothetical protein [Cytobacillus oceanisediminis]